MPAWCVVGGCSNTINIQEGIGLHTIPFYDDGSKRAKWVQWFALSISNQTISLDAWMFRKRKGVLLAPWLERDEFGVIAFPSILAAAVASEEQQSVSGAQRQRRMVRYFTVQMFFALLYQFPFLFNFLKRKYFLQTVKAAIKPNVGLAATSRL